MYCTVRALLPHSTHLLRSLPLVFPRVTASTAVSVSQDGKRISLAVDGEPERRYHGVWLRHNCRCPKCLNVTSNQNIVHHSELIDLSIKEATVNDGGKCRVEAGIMRRVVLWDTACNFNVFIKLYFKSINKFLTVS